MYLGIFIRKEKKFLSVSYDYDSGLLVQSMYDLGLLVLPVTKYVVAQIAVVALKKLLRDMYVDYITTSFCTMEEGLSLYTNQNTV